MESARLSDEAGEEEEEEEEGAAADSEPGCNVLSHARWLARCTVAAGPATGPDDGSTSPGRCRYTRGREHGATIISYRRSGNLTRRRVRPTPESAVVNESYDRRG